MGKILGIDIGSLSIKAAVYDSDENRAYEIETALHHRQPLRKTLELLPRWLKEPSLSAAAFTGAVGEELAEYLKGYYVNAHLASARANLQLYPRFRTVLNIGASSSGLIFFKQGPDGKPELEDIALPPHCSAGTGSFLDQSASRFGYSIKEFSRLALRSRNPENISGTCAVFAGSDMIDKQQKGARKDDIAAGLHYALAHYLTGTLGKGRKIRPPFSFQGGVAENPSMVRALQDVLNGNGTADPIKIFIPPLFRSMSAIGAAVSAAQEGVPGHLPKIPAKKEQIYVAEDKPLPALRLNDRIIIRKGTMDEIPDSRNKIPVFIGVDVGSVSTCLAVLFYPAGNSPSEWKLAAKKYLPTRSSPLKAVSQGLSEIHKEWGGKIEVRDIAVTGSGRKLIADYLGGVRDVNEITAHRTAARTAAARLDISFHEIFEIGGQDSKYMKGIEQFDMNKSCAAGTGSFLEEQAKHLGVPVEEIAPSALRANRPVSLGNKKCTVFIEEELASRQGRMEREDLLASAVHAVAENYLNQFKIGDKKGKTIFFQGGVALNSAAAAALQHYTQARIIVPEHAEVMGAVGAAVYARQNYTGMTSFSGLERIKNRRFAVSSFQCRDCPNTCNVAKVTTSDNVILYGGDRCEKYSLSTGQRKKIPSHIPDLFREREKILHETSSPPLLKKSRTRIGIPRLFSLYYEYFPLWRGFFESLGFEVITSGKTNAEIIRKGLDHVAAETCFPAELSCGHIKDLIDKKADCIFFPSLIDSPQTSWKERKTFYCTLSQNMPFAAAASLPDMAENGIRILSPAIRLHEMHRNLEPEMIRTARELGIGKRRAQKALQAGWNAWKGFKRRIRERGKEIFDNPEKWGTPIVVAGRPYTIGDPYINVDLPNMVIKAGGFPIPLDYLPLEDTDIGDIQDLANWNFYHQVMRAASIIRSYPGLHSIFFSVFSCGPDSFLEEFYREGLGGKSFLGLEVGKTTAPAHIQTRVEAFMDSIKNRESKPHSRSSSNLTVHTPLKRRTLYVPDMDEDVPVFKEVMKLLNVDVEILPVSTPQSLSLANRFIPEKTCLPVRMTAGDYLSFLLQNSPDPQKTAFFNHQADGACRQKVYHVLQQLVFRRLGYDSIPIITPSPGKSAGYIRSMELINGGKTISRLETARFFLRFWKSVTANEWVRQLVLSRRPYEKIPGAVDKAYKEGLQKFCGAVTEGNIRKAAFDFIEKILSVPLRERTEKPHIGIVGEGYVRLHQPSNQYCIRHLEELGAVTVLPMAASFLNYSLEYISAQTRSLILRFIKYVKEFVEKSIMDRIHSLLAFPEPHPRSILKEAARFLDLRAASEAVEGIGLASLYAQSGKISGILNLIPAHCMAGSALQCYLEKLHREEGIPVLTLTLDGICDKTFKANLELLMHKAGGVRSWGNG